ncbi:MAG: radical SAM protein [Acidobacteriota bacterium]
MYQTKATGPVGDVPPAAGCIMCDSLYVKPDGGLPCWDDVGEGLILRTLDEEALIAGREEPIFSSPHLVAIRRAFLEGRAPHPEFCSRCPVYGHGVARNTHPRVINNLHIEPAYLCQLACPQCFTPKQRLGLKKPPYYMTLEFYRGLLSQLRSEGIEHIRVVHFEGRGEPLLQKKLGEFVIATKELFPNAFVMATSHGNFKYQPWMHTSGMDLLRFSADGAYEESYQKYRIGGKLEKVLKLMADIKANRPQYPDSPLRVEWKYILFEWNDSEEELKRAGGLALERDATLRLCLTHTPGRSKRVPDEAALDQLAQLIPGARPEMTFQLRDAPPVSKGSPLTSEYVEGLLFAALACYGRKEPGRAKEFVLEALELGTDLDFSAPDFQMSTLWKEKFAEVTTALFCPATASGLANIAYSLHRWEAAESFFRRYLELAPAAEDRQKIEGKLFELEAENRRRRAVERTLEARAEAAAAVRAEEDATFFAEEVESLLAEALASYRGGASGRAEGLLRDAVELETDLEFDAAEVALSTLWNGRLREVVAALHSPATASGLANIALHLHQWRAAETFFRRYLQLAPTAEDRQKIESTALELAVGNRLKGPVDRAAEASARQRRRAVAAAVELDGGIPKIVRRWPRALPWLRRQVAQGARPQTLLQLARLREAEGDARTALHWLDAALRRGAPAEAATLDWRERLSKLAG